MSLIDNNSKFSDIEIKRNVEICINILFKNDSFLLENGLHERTVAHKLAEYLQTKFQGWNVDCEYNRKGLDIKTLEGIKECSDQRSSDRILPDIIVHQRNSDENLLVIEIKIERNDDCDIEKLRKFTSSNEKFKYRLGLFLKFNLCNEPLHRWFKNGNEI